MLFLVSSQVYQYTAATLLVLCIFIDAQPLIFPAGFFDLNKINAKEAIYLNLLAISALEYDGTTFEQLQALSNVRNQEEWPGKEELSKVRNQEKGSGEEKISDASNQEEGSEEEDEEDESIEKIMKNGKETVIGMKSEEETVIGTKKEEEPVIGTKKGEEPVIGTKSGEETVIGTKKEEEPVIGMKSGEETVIGTKSGEEPVIGMKSEEESVIVNTSQPRISSEIVPKLSPSQIVPPLRSNRTSRQNRRRQLINAANNPFSALSTRPPRPPNPFSALSTRPPSNRRRFIPIIHRGVFADVDLKRPQVLALPVPPKIKRKKKKKATHGSLRHRFELLGLPPTL